MQPSRFGSLKAWQRRTRHSAPCRRRARAAHPYRRPVAACRRRYPDESRRCSFLRRCCNRHPPTTGCARLTSGEPAVDRRVQVVPGRTCRNLTRRRECASRDAHNGGRAARRPQQWTHDPIPVLLIAFGSASRTSRGTRDTCLLKTKKTTRRQPPLSLWSCPPSPSSAKALVGSRCDFFDSHSGFRWLAQGRTP
jgi:hypothetical protein